MDQAQGKVSGQGVRVPGPLSLPVMPGPLPGRRKAGAVCRARKARKAKLSRTQQTAKGCPIEAVNGGSQPTLTLTRGLWRVGAGTAHLQVPAVPSQSRQDEEDEVTLEFVAGWHAGLPSCAVSSAPRTGLSFLHLPRLRASSW